MHKIFLNQSKLILIVIIILFIDIDTVFSHAPHDDIYGLKISPEYDKDQKILVLVRGQLLISKNGGKAWKRIVNGLTSKERFTSLEIDPRNKDIVFTSSLKKGIYKSKDGGFSWLPSSKGLSNININSIHIDRFSSDIVFAAGLKEKIYRSSNGGKDWHIVPSLNTTISAINSAQKNKFLIVGDNVGTLYISRNSGKKWSKKYNFPNSCSIKDIVISPKFITDRTFFVGTNGCGIYKTVNAGETFISINNGLESTSTTSLAISPNYESDSTLFVSTWNKGVFRSTDKGNIWHRYSNGLSKSNQADEYRLPHFRKVIISNGFVKDKTIFLAGFNGLFKSKDSGNSWLEKETLSSALIVGLALSPNYRNDSTLAVTTYLKGAYISQDGGLTWKSMNTGLIQGDRYIQPGDQIARLFDIKFSPNYFFDKTVFSSSWKKFLVSMNKGKYWNKVPVEPKKVGATISISPDFASDSTIFLGTKKGNILRSTDRGKSFVSLMNLERQVLSIVISPTYSRDKTIYINTKKEIYKSVDSGNNFTSIFKENNLSNLVISPVFNLDKSIFIGTNQGIYKTSNNGETWLKLNNELDNLPIASITISPNYKNDNELVSSVQGKGLYKSNDRGLTFTRVGNDLITSNHLFSNFSFASNQTAVPIKYSPSYIEDKIIFGFSDTQLFKSMDGGENWKVVFSPKNTESKNILASIYYQILYNKKIKVFIISMLVLISSLLFIRIFYRNRNSNE